MDVEPLLAAGGWAAHLHPRGRNGRFIEKWSWVKWFDPLTTDHGRGQAVGVVANPNDEDNPIVTVRLDNGSEREILAHELESAPRTKAKVLEPGHGAPSGRPGIEVGQLTDEHLEAIEAIEVGDDDLIDTSWSTKRYGQGFDAQIPSLDEAVDQTVVTEPVTVYATTVTPKPAVAGDVLRQRGFLDSSYETAPSVAWIQAHANDKGFPTIFKLGLEPGDHALPIGTDRLILPRATDIVVDKVTPGPGVLLVEGHLKPWAITEEEAATVVVPAGIKPELGLKIPGIVPPTVIEPRSSIGHSTRRGQYEAERSDLHDNIVAAMLKGHEPQDDPVMYWTGGGPASGKSTIRDQLPLPDDIVLVDPDWVKAAFPDYQAMIADPDFDVREKAAGFVHEESSQVARRGRELAFDNEMNLIIDGIGDNGYERVRSKVTRARKAGYGKVIANYVTVPTEVAVDRALERAKKEGRHVNEPFIRRSHADVSRTVVDLVKHRTFDELNVWDTSGPVEMPPVLIARQIGDDVEILEPDLWASFVSKGGKGYEVPPDLERVMDARSRPITEAEAYAAQPGDKFTWLEDDTDVVLQGPFTEQGGRLLALVADDGGSGDLVYTTFDELGLFDDKPEFLPITGPIIADAGPDYHDGVMICLRPSDPDSLEVQDGLSPEEMHMTLSYLGTTGEAADVRADAQALVDQLSQTVGPLTARVNDVANFGDDGAARVALLDFPGLELEQMATAARSLPGAHTDHGFTPHLTLGYDMGDDVGLELTGKEIEFDAIELCYGEDRHVCKLLGHLPTIDDVNEMEYA